MFDAGNHVIALTGTVDPWNPKAVRAAMGSSLRLPVEVRPGPGLTVSGDGDQLEQLLINLIRNGVDAVRFSPADGVPPSIPGCPFSAPGHWLVGTVGRIQAFPGAPNR